MLAHDYVVPGVADGAMKAMDILAVEPENRSRMGKLGGCQGQWQRSTHIGVPTIVEHGLS